MHVLFKKVFKIVLHHGMSAWSLISNDNCFLILITNPIGHRGLSCLFITHGLTNIGAGLRLTVNVKNEIVLDGLTTIPLFCSFVSGLCFG